MCRYVPNVRKRYLKIRHFVNIDSLLLSRVFLVVFRIVFSCFEREGKNCVQLAFTPSLFVNPYFSRATKCLLFLPAPAEKNTGDYLSSFNN